MAIKRYKLIAGKFFYTDKDGVLKRGMIGEVFEREEEYVSHDMFQLVGGITTEETPELINTTLEEPETHQETNEEIDDRTDETRGMFDKKSKKNR